MFSHRRNKSYGEFHFQLSKLLLELIDDPFTQLMTMRNVFIVQAVPQEHAQVTELRTVNQTDGLRDQCQNFS